MGLLDGGLQAVFAGAFGPLFLDGTLHKVETAPDGEGGVIRTPADTPIKGMVDRYSEAYRAAAGIPETDARLFVLQHGVGAAPDTDSEITLRGARYRVMAVDQDPAQAAWTIRGRPV